VRRFKRAFVSITYCATLNSQLLSFCFSTDVPTDELVSVSVETIDATPCDDTKQTQESDMRNSTELDESKLEALFIVMFDSTDLRGHNRFNGEVSGWQL
jgi:hypothetical protein